MHLDMTGPEPTIRCMWCGKTILLRDISEKAYGLSADYFSRMVKDPEACEKIGDDLWVTDGYLAEIAGEMKLGSYTDRKEFKHRDVISPTLDYYRQHEDEYEEAAISEVIYRGKGGYEYIAALQSPNRTVYIDERFTEHIQGIFKPYIRAPLDPVIIKAHGVVRRIVMPVRFTPPEQEQEGATSLD